MDKIKTIIYKEWADVFKNRMVFFTTAFLPLIFVILPFFSLAFMPDDPVSVTEIEQLSGELPPFMADLCAEQSEMACVKIFMLQIYSLLFMMVPGIIPVSIAAYSIVGEKNARSLEPLLATPITRGELLTGKILAAMIPAVTASWIAFMVYYFIVVATESAAVAATVVAPMWLIGIFVVGPLLALLSVSFAMIVSSRVTDPRAAEQLSALVIMPILLMLFGQATGLFLLNSNMMIILAIILLLLDGIVLYLTIQTFEREQILTRWK